ncbi:MAG: hypothetical protein OEV00_14475 [Acidobacteriota bacterium]|nr:hypothetical protein [Acidobacteriota bacterium]MDH3786515.1 hypothetical protein [Acidobacteriota bacterium]
MTDWKSSLRSDPMPWLLETACAPIRYRVLTELMELGRDDPEVQKVRLEVQDYAPALQLQRVQRKDGSWGGHVSAGDPRKYQASIENSLYRLYEYGWDRESKPVKAAAKTLRTFLTKKKDLKFFEFSKLVKADEKRNRYYRWFLRILSIELLVRGGYLDSKNQHLVMEMLDRTSAFVDSPVSRNPVEEIGAAIPLIRPQAWQDGYTFMPDIYLLRMFAFSPWLLNSQAARMRLKKIFDYVVSPTYQDLAPELGLVRTDKGSFARSHGLAVLPAEHYLKKGHLDELMILLEIFSRLGLINRYPILMSQFEWLVSQQGKDGHWNFSTKLINDSSRWTQLLRVEKDWRSPNRKEADMTFRMLLIMKNQWERQVTMLGRRDDGYPI